MKAKEIRDLGLDELSRKERELKEEYFKLSFQHSIRPLENTSKIRQIRKDIARVKTVMHGKRST